MTTFDKLADSYKKSIEDLAPVTGYKLDYFSEYKIIDLKYELEKQKIYKQDLEILDFGCGVGLIDPFFVKYFPNSRITACDVSSHSIELAEKNNSNLRNVEYHYIKPNTLPDDKKYDIIFLANVLRHIPKEHRFATMTMLKNALKPDGIIMVYELNPFNPISLYAYFNHDIKYNAADGVCAMTAGYAKRLFRSVGLRIFSLKYRFYIPKFLYKLIFLEKYLKNIPLGASFYIVAKKDS